MLSPGRLTHGGAWGYWFCAECNGKTGRWDEEYLLWWWPILWKIHGDSEAVRQSLFGVIEGDPGSFVRCVWAWMFAMVADLHVSHREIAQAVLSGEPVVPPDDLQLLLAATDSRRFWLAAQPRSLAVRSSAASSPWPRTDAGPRRVPNAEVVELPWVVISAPPFNVVLAPSAHHHDLPHAVVNRWLEDRALVRRSVPILLPMVSAEFKEVGIEYRDIAPCSQLVP